jgi:hypothetical protein
MRTWMRLIMMLALAAGLGSPPCRAAEAFVPPAEDVVVFRRDRLPMDVESMAELSGHLLTLAKAHGGKSSVQRRTVAQLLALAAALQPASAPVREFAAAYAAGKREVAAGAGEAGAARRRAREMLGWLGDPGANEDALALAACLKDVLAAADPDHPESEKHLAAGEQGPWQGWVQPVAAFRTRDGRPRRESGPDPRGDPDAVAETPGRKPVVQAEKPAVKLPEAGLLTIVWAADQPGATRELRPIALSMKAGPRPPRERREDDGKEAEGEQREDAPPAFACGWNNPGALLGRSSEGHAEARQLEWRKFQEVAATAVSAAETLLGTLPGDAQAVFAPGGKFIYRAEKDGAALSGALAVLIHAAFSGHQPQGAVIAEVRADGSLHLPPDFWLRLRALPAAGVGRLVLPTAAGPYLPSLLALEIPEVFFHSEILLADTLADLIALSTGRMDEQTAQASAAFHEIRADWGGKPVGPFVNNRAVRQPLEAIARQAPCHASARLLAIQGAAQRPTTLPKPLLAWELLNITRRTDWIAQAATTENIKGQDLLALAESARPLVSALDRYTELRDRELNDAAGEILVALRTFSRALRKTTDSEGNWIDRPSDLRAFKEVHQAITGKLRAAAAIPL